MNPSGSKYTVVNLYVPFLCVQIRQNATFQLFWPDLDIQLSMHSVKSIDLFILKIQESDIWILQYLLGR